MPKEVKEEAFVKLRKEDVVKINTFYATIDVNTAVDRWKRKSVSILSPKSGRIVRQKKLVKEETKDHTGFFSRVLEDFKKVKVSDFTYTQPKVRQNSVYKPFWATNVTETSEECKKVAVKDVERAIVSTNEATSINLTNNKLDKVSDECKTIVQKKPKLISIASKDGSNVLPKHYGGSNLFMPTGERVFWVGNFSYFAPRI